MRRSGFTLIELMVALAVSGVVVLTAAGIFAGVATAGREVRTARTRLDRTMNARRWLAATFLSLEVGQTPGSSFEGRPDHAAFTSWELMPGGWMEPRRITLGLTNGSFQASTNGGIPLSLADSVSALSLDYLLEPGLNATWVREWISPVSAPLAVRVRIQRGSENAERGAARVDTVLFLIKERG